MANAATSGLMVSTKGKGYGNIFCLVEMSDDISYEVPSQDFFIFLHFQDIPG